MSDELTDGFATKIVLAAGAVKLYAKSVTPPGVDAGGEIDVTTMEMTRWRQFVGKQLVTLTEARMTCAYDVAVYDEIVTNAGVNQMITVLMPDGSMVGFWGFLDKFTPNEHSEGEQPTAEVTFVPTNRNASNVETGPVYSASGLTTTTPA